MVYAWVVAGPKKVFLMEDCICNRNLLRSRFVGEKNGPIFTASAVCWSSSSPLRGKTDSFILGDTFWIKDLQGEKKKTRFEHLLLLIWPFRQIEQDVRELFYHRILWRNSGAKQRATQCWYFVPNTPEFSLISSGLPLHRCIGIFYRFLLAQIHLKSYFCLRDTTVNSSSQPKPFFLSRVELGGRGDLETSSLLFHL